MNSKSTNPAIGGHLEPFGGITTFMRKPASRKFDGVDVAIVGIPFDSGTSYRSGTRFGPRKIRESSLLLWGYNQVLNIAPSDRLEIIDYGDVDVVPVDIKSTNQAITNEITGILDAGVTVISLGGDHSITLPILRAFASKFGPLAVVHFDSHPDTWDYEYPSHPYSHGTPFRRAIEENLVDPNSYVQVGIRGSTTKANDLDDARGMGARVITINEAFDEGIPAVLKIIHETVGNKLTYISLDIDAVDPAFAPGTGTPEVGGFNSYQILQLIRGLQGIRMVGFDLVEVSPPYDSGEITSILAANIAFEFLSLIALQK